MSQRAVRSVRVVAVLCAALLLAGCARQDGRLPPPPPHTPDAVGKAPERVLVIVLDAAAASHFAYRGYPRQTTPRLDAMVAERGFLFSDAHGVTSSVLPAAIAALSGRHPVAPSSSVPAHRLVDEVVTYPEVFAAAGFATLGLSESPLVTDEYGIATAFAGFRAYPGIRAIKSIHPRPRNHPATDKLLGHATRWIKKRKDERWLAYLHIMRPHSPYFGSRPYEAIYTERWYTWWGNPQSEMTVRLAPERASPTVFQYFVDLYDENLTSADAHVADLIERLSSEGALDDTLVVVTSGHGEAFMEHGHVYHDVSVYDEVTRVPLLFLLPEGLEIAPGRSDARVSLVDLYPTLLDLFRLERPEGLEGRSLVPLMRGAAPEDDRVTVAQTSDATRFAFTRGQRKLIVHVDTETQRIVGQELYDLSRDPGERDDLSARGEAAPELLALAEDYVRATLGQTTPPNPPRSEFKQYELEILGYLEIRRDASRGIRSSGR